MGRLKGSKNKTNLSNEALKIKEDNKISLNVYGNVKDLKSEIRRLKKIKLECRAGTKERIELHRKIKELKLKLEETKKQAPIPEPEKIDTKIYVKRYYTGYLSPITIKRFKDNFDIEFIKTDII
jgi:hypothetical protein